MGFYIPSPNLIEDDMLQNVNLDSLLNSDKDMCKMSAQAAATGYLGGIFLKWHFPGSLLTPLGCTTASLLIVPGTVGCGLLGLNIGSLINEKFEFLFGVGALILASSCIPLVGLHTFSQNPLASYGVIASIFMISLAFDVSLNNRYNSLKAKIS